MLFVEKMVVFEQKWWIYLGCAFAVMARLSNKDKLMDNLKGFIWWIKFVCSTRERINSSLLSVVLFPGNWSLIS